MRRDPETGRFLSGGPNATARRLAAKNLRLAQREARESNRTLGEELRNRREIGAAERRYARALDRAGNALGGIQGGVLEQQARVDQVMRGIGQGSRGNYLTNLFQGRQQEFARGGAGRNLPEALQQQARNVREAWDLATAGGRENLQLMQRLSTEMAGLVRQQNELNRSGAGRSIAFEAGRRGQERITALSRMVGADPGRIRGLRSAATNVIATGNTGDIASAREAQRRMNVAITRYERELNATAKELALSRRSAARGMNVRMSWQGALAEMGSIAGASSQRSRARSLNLRTSWQGALAEMGTIAAQNRRALPDKNLLAQRIAGSGGVAPVRLDELQAQARKREAEEAKRAAGSVGRFAAALEREEKRLRSLGIGVPSRVGGPAGRNVGAIPMGGTGGRPGMFNQYPFPAGPGNVYGAAEFKAIQAAQRPQRPTGLFRGSLRQGIGEGLIGGAFPLLFGQGLGASAGGLAGGFGGGLVGGSFGFGLSLIGTAVGGAVDTTANNLKELAGALKSPNETLQALEKSGFRVGDSLKFQVDQLQSVGRAYDAQTLVLREVEKRLGPGAVTELNQLDAAHKRLQEQYGAVASELQVRLLPVLQGFIEFLGFAAGQVGGFASQSRLQRVDPQTFERLRAQAIRETAGGPFGMFGDKKAYDARLNELSRQELSRKFAGERSTVSLSQEQAYEAESKRIEESRQLADKIQSAYREAFSLQRRAHDLQRDGADINKEIADYSYRKQREIFELRQQVADKEIENTRAAAQNRIERGDLSARQTFAAAVGFEQQLLSNVRETMRTRMEGEADIEQSRRRLELAMARLNRDAEDYKRTNAREIEDIERRKLAYIRSVEDYKMQVADYVLQRSREAADYSRQSAALAGTPAGGGAPSGPGQMGPAVTPRTLMGVPGVIEYLTGDRSSPGYRADHGGSNYHEHIAFASRQIRDNVIAMLRKNGIVIGSTDGGRHAPNSYHYSGQAVDIPGAQVPVGQEDALARRVRSLIAGYLGGGTSTARTAPAAQLSGARKPVLNLTPIGPTPSAAPASAANAAAYAALGLSTKDAQRISEEQIKLRQKGIELGQIEQILQANQLPQLQQQYDTLKLQMEARRQNLSLSDQAATIADAEAEATTRIAQIEKDRKNALAGVQKQYGNNLEAIGQVNRQADAALRIAKGEEELRRKIVELNTKAQGQERARTEILQMQEALSIAKVEAAALENGQLQASSVELMKASTLYQQAEEAQQRKLVGLAIETEELRKQNEFRRQMVEMQRDTALTGAGLRAGFIGAGARAFEQGLRDFNGDTAKAADLAKQSQLLESQRLVWDNLEKSIVGVSDAISGALTNGLVDIANGSKKIEDVGRDMLNNMARSFADAAQQQLTALLQRQLAGAMGGLLGGGAPAAAGGGILGSFLSAPSVLPGFTPSFTFGGFLANGGDAKVGEAYVVGEKEPEFFFPGVNGRVVPKSEMERVAGLRNEDRDNSPIDISYTVTEEAGRRYVTEEQFRRSNAALLQRSQNATLSRIRNSRDVREYIGV